MELGPEERYAAAALFTLALHLTQVTQEGAMGSAVKLLSGCYYLLTSVEVLGYRDMLGIGK